MMVGFVLVPDCTIHFILKYRASEASEEKFVTQ